MIYIVNGGRLVGFDNEREVVLVARNRKRRNAPCNGSGTKQAIITYVLNWPTFPGAAQSVILRHVGMVHCTSWSTTPLSRQVSKRNPPEGVELQFATNVLAYYRMIRAFTPYLLAAEGSQVVNVASYWRAD